MFTYIKYRARVLMRGKTAVGFLLLLARLPALAGGIVSLCALVGCIAEGAQSITGFSLLENVWYRAAFYAFLVFATLFFPIFYSAVSFASRAYFERKAANGCRPRIFFNLKQALRYLRFLIAKNAYCLLWAMLFFSPFLALAALITALMKSGELYAPVFVTLCVCALSVFFTGAAFFCTALTRYFMCEYLLCSNPKMPVRDVISESVFIMRGREKKTALFFVSCFPWLLLCLTGVFLPFVYAFIKFSCVRLSSIYFGEDEVRKKRGSAVIYYINARTKFSEHTEGNSYTDINNQASAT